MAASLYIVLIVLILNYASKTQASSDSFVIPVIMISLFTLSAAIMGYLFCYQPIILYLDGKKEKAIKLFLQTIGIFASITVLALILFLTGILS